MEQKLSNLVAAGTITTATTAASTTLTIPGRIQWFRFINLDTTDAIYVNVNGDAATNANYTNQFVLTKTTGVFPDTGIVPATLNQLSISTASSANTPALYWMVGYLGTR